MAKPPPEDRIERGPEPEPRQRHGDVGLSAAHLHQLYEGSIDRVLLIEIAALAREVFEKRDGVRESRQRTLPLLRLVEPLCCVQGTNCLHEALVESLPVSAHWRPPSRPGVARSRRTESGRHAL